MCNIYTCKDWKQLHAGQAESLLLCRWLVKRVCTLHMCFTDHMYCIYTLSPHPYGRYPFPTSCTFAGWDWPCGCDEEWVGKVKGWSLASIALAYIHYSIACKSCRVLTFSSSVDLASLTAASMATGIFSSLCETCTCAMDLESILSSNLFCTSLSSFSEN